MAAAAGAIHRLAEQLGWPVLADPRSGCRLPRPATVATFDALLRHQAFAAAHAPEVVLRFGHPPTSKVLAEWSAEAADQLQVSAGEPWIDPANRLAVRVVCEPSVFCAALDGQLRGASNTPWLARWRRAESRARAAIDANLDEPAINEPALARRLLADLRPGSRLVVCSSMPVRDLEWYAAPRDGVFVHANRGANGIDGVTATAIGVALASAAPTVLLTGDIAAVHDSSALVALRTRPVDLTIIVVDNDGGGIFSFLPQADLLPADRFEQLFGTPHGTEIGLLAAAHGLAVTRLEHLDQLPHLLAEDGPRVAVAHTDRATNVSVHRRIHAAVAAALG